MAILVQSAEFGPNGRFHSYKPIRPAAIIELRAAHRPMFHYAAYNNDQYNCCQIAAYMQAHALPVTDMLVRGTPAADMLVYDDTRVPDMRARGLPVICTQADDKEH